VIDPPFARFFAKLVLCSASLRGIKFTVDDNKVMQAFADIPAAAFVEFSVHCGSVEVCTQFCVAFFVVFC